LDQLSTDQPKGQELSAIRETVDNWGTKTTMKLVDQLASLPVEHLQYNLKRGLVTVVSPFRISFPARKKRNHAIAQIILLQPFDIGKFRLHIKKIVFFRNSRGEP